MSEPMQPLDGNAIAGPLAEHFGIEMTAVTGTCRHCGHRSQVAELAVYACAPGSVARCGTCGQVVIVVTETRGEVRAFAEAFIT